MFGWLFNRATPKPTEKVVKVVRGKYDAALENREDRNHWNFTDNLSPVEANSLDVRQKIRKKSRYELDNNGSGKGIVKSYVNDLIGTTPTLTLAIDNDKKAEKIQKAFRKWAKRIRLGSKMRLARTAQLRDGESFAIFFTNKNLDNSVKLDISIIETDLVHDPQPKFNDSSTNIDGIFLDEYRNIVKYRVLRAYPGYTGSDEYDDYPAEFVHHFVELDRPGQVRGVPELASTILQFANLRRYTKAVLGAAELSAELTVMLESDGSANGEEPDPLAPGEEIPINRNMMTTLPLGWKATFTKPEQPTTTYPEFKKEILTEIVRPLNMPRNIAIGSSADYNYSSGKLDQLSYIKRQNVERNDLEEVFLDKVFWLWYEEAYLVGIVPSINPDDVELEWNWDADSDIDPEKEASANETRLRTNQTTLKDIYAAKNRNWRTALRQRAMELDYQRELGMEEDNESTNNSGQRQSEDSDNGKRSSSGADSQE